MNPDRVISVIPWEMASEYVARMTACEGAESEAYYHEAYHAYWDWGRLDSSGFTERAFQAAREAERGEGGEGGGGVVVDGEGLLAVLRDQRPEVPRRSQSRAGDAVGGLGGGRACQVDRGSS